MHFKQGVRRQKIGDIGEAEFGRMAVGAGFDVHPPARDRRGWDQLLEIHVPVPDETLSADHNPGPLGAFVQVKTTTGDRDPEGIKLSVLDRAVKDPNPWFFAHVRLDPSDRPVEIRVLHVDRELMAVVLRAERASQGALHKRRLALPWSTAERIPLDDFQALRHFVLKTVGDPRSYAAAKLAHERQVGYDEYPGRIRFRLSSGEDLVRMGDALLGSGDDVSVRDMAFGDVRFGLESTLKVLPGVSTLRIAPRGRPCRLAVAQESGLGRVEVSGTLFALPDGFHGGFRIRFQGHIAEVIIGAEPGSIAVNLAMPKRRVCVAEVATAARLIRLLDEKKPLVLELGVADSWILVGTLRPSSFQMTSHARAVFEAARAVEALVLATGHAPTEYDAHVDELERMNDHGLVRIADGLTRTEGIPNCEGAVVLTTTIEKCEPIGLFLLHLEVFLATRVLVLVLGVEGPVLLDEVNGRTRLRVSSEGRLRNARVFKRDAATGRLISMWLDSLEAQIVDSRSDVVVVPAWRRRKQSRQRGG